MGREFRVLVQINIQTMGGGVDAFNFSRMSRNLGAGKGSQHYKQETVCQSHGGVDDSWSPARGAMQGAGDGRRCRGDFRISLEFKLIDSHLPPGVPFTVMVVACTSGRAPSAGSTSRQNNSLSERWRECFYRAASRPGRIAPCPKNKHLMRGKLANT